jgi:RHS repeat-associated protein
LLVYDEAGHVLGEYTSSGALVQETIWMSDTPVATIRPNGTGVTVYYVHTDHLETPRKVTLPSNNSLVWRFDPDTFGSSAPTSAFIYNLRFPGQFYLAESTLTYNYFRTYDSQMGRFIEADPIGLAGRVNPYAYVGGNPISRDDPLGLIVQFDSRNPFYDIQLGILRAAYAQIGAGSFYGNMLENTLENSPFIFQISPGPDPMYPSDPVHTNPFTKGIYVNTNCHPAVQVKGSCASGDVYTDGSPLLELEHELGHAATGVLDNGPGDMNNVNQNVNPFRADARLPVQTAYGAGPLAQPMVIPLPHSGRALVFPR